MKGCRRQQRGFSLVELMVALLLGLMVMAAIGSVYVGGKRTGKARDAMSLLQENGRIALRHLQNGIIRAGYSNAVQFDPFVHCGIAAPDELFLSHDSGPHPLAACTGTITPGVGTLSDVISVSFVPDDEGYKTDCLGIDAIARARDGNPSTVAIGGQERVVNSYFVEGDMLKCRGSSSTPQPIADGIHAMQVQYLVEYDARFYWMTAAQLQSNTLGAGWEQVTAVRLALLASSVEAGRDEVSAQTFRLLDVDVTTPADNLAYRVFTTTIMLRNRRQNDAATQS